MAAAGAAWWRHRHADHCTGSGGLSFEVPRGSITGLFGPNGSGKTTMVGILSTALAADSGQALVCGHDVVSDAAAVRGCIGFAGQFAAVDANLTGRENLRLIGRLSRLPRRGVADRAEELLARFGLAEAAGRLVRGYSGGMRASVMVKPSIRR
jgi:ABC-2 type transport system ATP-binding protein